MRRLAILGASGHAKVVADVAARAGWERVECFDDAGVRPATARTLGVVGTGGDLLASLGEYDGVFVAIGDNRVRLQRMKELIAAGATMESLTHPSAVVAASATVGRGTVLVASAVVNPFATIGDGCIINTGATVDHDCVLADGVHVSPGAHLAGAVRVGEATWIGIGAVVRQGIVIGSNVMVGAGAAVVRDIPDGDTVIGVPARSVRKGETE